MIHQVPQGDRFKLQLRESLLRETKGSRTVTVARHDNVYTCGDQDDAIYFIESGQVKLVMLSPEGKECLLAICTRGDIFGELCLAGLGGRLETATAMEETVLRLIPSSKFFLRLGGDSLLEGFVRYLALRIADQQEAITNLVTVDCEQRLGKILLQLARKLGRKNPHSVCIEHKISHEELAKMVGTTRPRISEFMQRFRARGLIEMSIEHFIVVKEGKLAEYLARVD